ncbi:MAG TPA: hypothetical protein VG225_14170 [Terracidiphilus sp.]|nr:hypothetical protein [Terracidiphilus sp.]
MSPVTLKTVADGRVKLLSCRGCGKEVLPGVTSGGQPGCLHCQRPFAGDESIATVENRGHWECPHCDAKSFSAIVTSQEAANKLREDLQQYGAKGVVDATIHGDGRVVCDGCRSVLNEERYFAGQFYQDCEQVTGGGTGFAAAVFMIGFVGALFGVIAGVAGAMFGASFSSGFLIGGVAGGCLGIFGVVQSGKGKAATQDALPGLCKLVRERRRSRSPLPA